MTSIARQADRITTQRKTGQKPNVFEFKRNDLLGPKADERSLQSSSAWKELRGMEGLDEVKTSVQALLDLCVQNADREDREEPMLQVALNRIFVGNP
jgi:hypothetical protein